MVTAHRFIGRLMLAAQGFGGFRDKKKLARLGNQTGLRRLRDCVRLIRFGFNVGAKNLLVSRATESYPGKMCRRPSMILSGSGISGPWLRGVGVR